MDIKILINKDILFLSHYSQLLYLTQNSIQEWGLLRKAVHQIHKEPDVTKVKEKRLKWIGQVMRESLERKIRRYFQEIPRSKRLLGWPSMRLQDNMRKNFVSLNTNLGGGEFVRIELNCVPLYIQQLLLFMYTTWGLSHGNYN